MDRKRLICIGAAAAAFLWTSAVGTAEADSVADFYKRKRITIYVSTTPGGGYDTYARTLGRHIGKHIPGKPRVIVKNRPGAGGLIMVNEMYNTLPKDGSVFGTANRGLPMEPLFGRAEAMYDPTKFTWLGSANNEVSLCVSWHTTKIKNVNDMLTRPWTVGSVGVGTDTDAFPRVINTILGARMKLVHGYPGGADINLATARGEVDGRCSWSWSSIKSTRPDWLRDKKINLLMQQSTARHPELPDIPFILDYAKTERDRNILKLIYSRQAWGRPYFGPPGIPADRAKALQVAFMATMKDPAFIRDAKRQKLELAPISGPEIKALMVALYNSPKELVAAAKAAISGDIESTKAEIPIETLMGEIIVVKRGGRRVTLKGGGKTRKVRVSGRRTKITVAGKKAKRKALKAGMKCELTYQGTSAKQFACQ